MENDQYTPEDLADLYREIFLKFDGELILFDMDAFADCETLIKWLSREKLKTTAPAVRKRDQVLAIEEVLFCDIKKVPLLVNGPFHAAAKWRLAHGKKCRR
jgi:hypothetical protein